jgi:transposase
MGRGDSIRGHGRLTVSVVNPAQIKYYGASRLTRSKTDDIDTRLIADSCAELQPLPWQAWKQSRSDFTSLGFRQDALQTMRSKASNCLDVSRDAIAKIFISIWIS